MMSRSGRAAPAALGAADGIRGGALRWLACAAEAASHYSISLRDRDRRRIAAALHETTTQDLVALRLNLACHKNGGVADKTPDLATLQHATDAALKGLRTYTYLLRPPPLEGGLSVSLKRYAKGLDRCTGFQTTVRINERADLASASVQRAILGILQEALLHRCVDVTHLAIHVRLVRGRLHLLVAHDGRDGHMHPSDHDFPSYPREELEFLNAWVRRVGAKITIRSNADGVRVHLCVAAN